MATGARLRRITVYCRNAEDFSIEVPPEDEPMWVKHIQEALEGLGVLKLWGIGDFTAWGTTLHFIRTSQIIGVTIHNVPQR